MGSEAAEEPEKAAPAKTGGLMRLILGYVFGTLLLVLTVLLPSFWNLGLLLLVDDRTSLSLTARRLLSAPWTPLLLLVILWTVFLMIFRLTRPKAGHPRMIEQRGE